MAESSQPLVVIGCAPTDLSAALRLATALRAAGQNVEIDTEGGRELVDNCAVFLPLVSDNSQTQLAGRFLNGWRRAAQRAEAMADATAFLLPIMVDKTARREARVPPAFKDRSWLRVEMWDPTEMLVQRVQAMLEQRVAAQEAAVAEQAAATEQAAVVQLARRWLGSLPPWVRRLRIVWILTLIVLPGGALGWRLLSHSATPAVAPANPALAGDRTTAARPGTALVPSSAPTVSRTATALPTPTTAQPPTFVTSAPEATAARTAAIPDSTAPPWSAASAWTADRQPEARAAGRDGWRPVEQAAEAAAPAAARLTAGEQPLVSGGGGTRGGGGGRLIGASGRSTSPAAATDRDMAVADDEVAATASSSAVASPAVHAWQVLVAQGDLPQARAILAKSVPRSASTAAEADQATRMICAAQLALWSGQPDEAVAALQYEPEAWIDTPMFTGPQGWWLGVALQAAGRPLAAQAVWREAEAVTRVRLQQNPGDAKAWLALAQVAAALQERDEALDALQRYDDSVLGRAGGGGPEHITVWAQLGDYTAAMNELTRRFRDHVGEWGELRQWLRYDPRWQGLRDQPGATDVAAR